MTTFKSQSKEKLQKKNLFQLKRKVRVKYTKFPISQKIILMNRKFHWRNFILKSNKQNKKDLVASDNFLQFYPFIKETTNKRNPCQSAEPTTEKEQPIEETKETPACLQNLQPKKNNL